MLMCPSNFDVESLDIPSLQANSDRLLLDQHTLNDLEIFDSEGELSLFQFCNLTRTKGGEQVLRQRMEAPWANAERIKDTQQALSFIIQHRKAFDLLPVGYVTTHVDTYVDGGFPIVIHNNFVEFTFGAYSLWSTHENHYLSISRGVQMSCRLIHGLNVFIAQGELGSACGELAPLLDELKTLLTQEKLIGLPEDSTDIGFGKIWKIMRMDQVFRVYEKQSLSRILALIYEIDALVALADVTSKNAFVFPHIAEGPMCIHAEGLVHPYVKNAIENPVELDQSKRGLFLTGPNMAGKTTYLRAFATALYLAHLGMGVPAKNYHFVPVERLISSISLSDNLHSGVSYFRAEALRVKDIARDVVNGYRVVAIMDEPFKGTNVKDTLEASLAILERFASRENFLFMFSSHQIELAEQLTGPIDCRYFSAIENEERLRFDYRLREGVAKQRIGMRVLKEEGVFEMLDGLAELKEVNENEGEHAIVS